MKWILIAGTLIVIAVGGLVYFGLPAYSWHQKMTITVEADGKVYSGSSVVRVRWRKNDPLGAVNGPEWITTVRGEAPFVEIPGRGVLFALLNPPGYYIYSTDLALEAFSGDLPRGPFAERLKFLEAVPDLSAILPSKLYPFFVTFDDIDNPKSVREVDPDDLAAVFGPGVKLESVTLEITDAPVTKGQVEGVIGWIKWPKDKWNSLSTDGRIPMRLHFPDGKTNYVSRDLLKSGD